MIFPHLSKYFPYTIVILIIINILLSTWWLLHGEIHYDIDISRDLLIIDQAVKTKSLFLIGPRSGVAAGIFHGPLWYYLNLPFFIISNGDPNLIGWFWWMLSIGTLILFYWVIKKLFNKQSALLATLLYSTNSIINPNIGMKQFFNPYGATILFPLFFYLLVRFLQTKKLKYLLFSLLVNGLMIQFQMAFGIPILILTTIILFYFLCINKLLHFFITYLILLIPLSTFILFDIRHNFLQLNSALKFIVNSHNNNFPQIDFIVNRIKSAFIETHFMLLPDNLPLTILYSILLIFLIFKYLKAHKLIYSLFIYYFFGFWSFLFVFKGPTGNYYWPFLPLIIAVYASFINILPHRIFYLMFIPVLIWNYYFGINYIKNYPLEITSRGINSWSYNKLIAETIYHDAPDNFGYFIFTPDRWGYNQRYAMEFVQKKYPQKKAEPLTKKTNNLFNHC